MANEHWGETPLEKLVFYKKGKKPKTLLSQEFSDSLPYINIEAFETGVFKQYADIKTSNICKNDDILVVWDGARFGLSGRNQIGAIGSTIMCLSPISVNSQFLFQFIKSKYSEIQQNPKGTGIPHVNPEVFWNFIVPIPPLAEQQRIVEKLDAILPRVKAAKARLEKIPLLLKRFRQSVMAAACSGKLTEEWREKYSKMIYNNEIRNDETYFTDIPNEWKIELSSKLCLKITDGEHQTPKKTTEGKMLLSAKNIRDGFIDYRDFDLISDNDFNKCIKRCNPEVNDVLIVSVGATIGRTAIKKEDTEFAIVRSVGLFKPDKNKILGDYLLHVLRTPVIQKFIMEESQGTAQPCFYINKMEQIPIPLPHISEQHEIVHRVEELLVLADSLEAKYNTAMQRIEKIEQSVLAKAFRGELVPQDPNDEPAEELLKRILEEKNKLLKAKPKKTK